MRGSARAPPRHRRRPARPRAALCSGASSSGSASSSSPARVRARSSSAASSGSRATRNSAKPCWRVPMISPSPRSSRSISASAKPSWWVARAAGARSPWARTARTPTRARRGRSGRAAGAAGRCRSARRPRRASRVAFGTSIPTSITEVATSTSAPPAANAAIASCLARGRIWPCSSTTSKSASSVVAQALVLGGRRAGLERLGLLDERADDEGLAPGPQLLADALVGPRPLALAARHMGLDGLAPAGQLPQHGRVEVPVGGEARACAGSAWPSGEGRAASGRPRRLAVERRRAAPRRSGAARRRPRPRDGRRRRRARSGHGCRRRGTARRWPAWPARRRAARAGVEPVSSAAVTLSPPSSDWIVAKCWSASVSVGAIRAACIPWSTARSIAARATTVLPEPTSPISRRCMGRDAGHVAVDRLERALLVAGRREGEAVVQPALRQRRRAVEGGRRLGGVRAARGGAAGRAEAAAARRRPGAAARRARRRRPGKVDGGQRRGPVGQPLVSA